MPTQNVINANSGTIYNALVSNGASVAPTFKGPVAFGAYLGTDALNQTGAGNTATVVFDTKYLDTNTAYNASNGYFTAPVSGLYEFICSVTLSNLPTGSLWTNLVIQTDQPAYIFQCDPNHLVDGNGFFSFQSTVISSLSSGDNVYVQVQVGNGSGDTATIKSGNYTYFFGSLIR